MNRSGRRVPLVMLLVTALVLASATAAFAFFTGSGSGSARAIADSLSAPTSPTATPNSSSQITVGWTNAVSQLAGASYQVTRTSGAGSPATVCTVTHASNTQSCTNTGLAAATTYNYSIKAIIGTNWQSSVITTSATTLAADGSGTLTTPTTNVAASSTGNTIVFTYTAAAGGISNGEVDIAVPTGWTPPVSTNAIGCTTVSTGTLSFSGQTIKVGALTLVSGGTLTVTYGATSGGACTAADGATATATTGAQTWQGSEKSTSGGSLTNLAASPSITVNAANGSGTLTTPTTSVVASSTGNTIVFTYTAAAGGISNGEVDVAVPAGWTAPVSTNATGCTTASTGTPTFSGQTIKVSALTLAGGGTLTITYGATSGGACTAGDGAAATSTAGAQTWQGSENSTSGGTLTNLAASPSITVNAAAGLSITSVVRDGGNNKYHFTGTGASGSSAVVVTLCLVNSFPCASPVTTSSTGTSPPAAWTSAQTAGSNLSTNTLFYARATQGASTSAVFPFYSTDLEPAVIPAGVALADGGANPGKAAAGDTLTVTYSEPLDATTFCSTWNNSGVQSSSASVQIVQNAANDTLNTLTVSGCTFNFGAVALNADYVSSTVTFGTSTVSWDPSTLKLTITLGGGTGQNTVGANSTPSYTASTSIKDRNGGAIAAGPWGGASSRF